MKIIRTKFEKLLVFQGINFLDKRGEFRELIIEKKLKDKIVFTVCSKSKKNVLRGLHMQTKKMQGKFISVIKGKILDIVVDCRKKSKTFGKSYSLILDSKKMNMIFVPSGFAHGFQTLLPDCEMLYLHTDYHNTELEKGYHYNSSDLKIPWPLEVTQISEKDKNLEIFKCERKKVFHEV